MIYNELIDLISDNFIKKLITISSKEEKIGVNTLDFESSKPIKKKRVNNEPKSPVNSNKDLGDTFDS